MAGTEGLHALTILEAGGRLRNGTLTSVALTEACLARIGALDDRLHAFITVTADWALASAALLDRELAAGRDRGPLHGIPVSLKDLIDQAGVATTAGSRVPERRAAASDATVTARLKAAGAVLVGKTNLHEFAFGTTSEDSAFGAVRHPVDQSRSAGGSSGGSAVAVATGMSLASIGTDTGGSVRIPSAACGVVGLKPTTGEIPCDGVVPLSRTLDHVGPLVRCVDDAAVLFHVLARTAPRLPSPVPPSRLRLARLAGYMEALLEPTVREVYERALERLQLAGATVVERTLHHADDIAAIYLHVVLPEAAAYHAATLVRCPERYTPAVRLRLEMGRYILAEDYLRALSGRSLIRMEVEAALADVDALVLPGLPILAPALGAESVPIDGVTQSVRALMLRLTQPFNLSGHPAIVLPAGESQEGLPVGLQLVGERTTLLLDVAARVERVFAGPTN
jgi:aspartyl-tRNA(Asn)/glutamyl-tRNA(Gln) amidotransferase subunit A